MSVLFWLFFWTMTTTFKSSECELLSSIPSHLLECYRSNGVNLDSSAPRRLDVFLQILRKLETHRSQLDLRLFSSAMLRSLRLDGIEQAQNFMETDFLTPYRATAFQFQRYKLLMDLLLPSQTLVSIEEDLTGPEKCLFHRMISSTVHRWQRGDEDVVCPRNIEDRLNAVLQTDDTSGRVYSRCPIEEGVVQTGWGTIAPGIVTAAIAAALEQQSVSMTDLLNTDVFKNAQENNIETLDEVIATPRIANADVNNVFVATLAGDLAEVAVNQGPRVGSAPSNISIGSNNRWNDTELPRIYYIFPQNETTVQWHITDAEILAGIDGLIIAKEINKWTSKLASVRLSQIIDMYYSHSGVSFNRNIKACNRQANFHKIFDQTELQTEMSNFAQILSLSQGTVYVPTEEVDRICKGVVTAFVSYLSEVLNRNQHECREDMNVPSMNLIVTTDAAWKKYQTEQFISSVSLSTDVSAGRSSLGFMHGNTGVWIASPADNLTHIFKDIQNFTHEWPDRLNFASVLTSLNVYLNEMRLNEATASVTKPSVILVASPSDRLTTSDLERSRDLMRSLRRNHFDIHFVFLAQDLSSFYDLNVDSVEFADLFLEVKSTAVTEAAQKVRQELTSADIPKRIIGALCEFNGTQVSQTPYEDFVLVNQKISYRIHPHCLHGQQLVTVMFRTTSGGEVRVCSAREGSEGELHCHQLGERQEAIFNLTQPCERSQQCSPEYFTITGVSAFNTCANMDCRSPNQIGFYVQHSGLRCLSLQNRAQTSMNHNIIFLCFTLLFSIAIR